MTYNVSMGTLNPTIPYYHLLQVFHYVLSSDCNMYRGSMLRDFLQLSYLINYTDHGNGSQVYFCWLGVIAVVSDTCRHNVE